MSIQFKQKVATAALGEIAPIIFRGVVNGWLENKTGKNFFDFLKHHVGQNWLNDLVPPRAQMRIRALIKNGLEWLTMEWFVKSIAREHPDIVSLIASSEYVRTELEAQISNIRDGLR